jgi:hypothetical protein
MGDLPFDVDAVSDALEERYDAEYVLAHGSAVRGRDDYDDVDVYAVCDVGYNRSFDEFDVGDETVDVLVHSPDAYRSFRDFYYWYPENLVTEIGMFRYAVPIVENERFEQVRRDVADPSDEVRFFIHTYHLGQLLRSRAKKDWKDLWVHTPWSVISVASAYWNEYPQTVHHGEYLDSLDDEQSELMAPMRTESGFPREITDELIELTTPAFLEWLETVRDGDTVEIHKRTQRRAIEAVLDAHPSRSPSDVTVVGSKQ